MRNTVKLTKMADTLSFSNLKMDSPILGHLIDGFIVHYVVAMADPLCSKLLNGDLDILRRSRLTRVDCDLETKLLGFLETFNVTWIKWF